MRSQSHSVVFPDEGLAYPRFFDGVATLGLCFSCCNWTLCWRRHRSMSPKIILFGVHISNVATSLAPCQPLLIFLYILLGTIPPKAVGV